VRGILGRRGGHRVDDHGGLLSLESVHRTDPNASRHEPLPQQRHLRVVGGNDENIGRGHRVRDAVVVNPLGARAQK